MNVADETRLAERQLYERTGTRHHRKPKRCPQCGAKVYRRRIDGACVECVIKESKKARSA